MSNLDKIFDLILFRVPRNSKPIGKLRAKSSPGLKRGRQRRERTEKPDCTSRSQSCGFGCIERGDNCSDNKKPNKANKNWSWVTSRVSGLLDKYVEKKDTTPGAATGKKVQEMRVKAFNEGEEVYRKVLKKTKGDHIIAENARDAVYFKYASALANKDNPDTLDAILETPHFTNPNTKKKETFREYGERLKKEKEEENNRGEYSDGKVDEFNNITPPSTDKYYKTVNAKNRNVSDEEVEAVWESLDKRVKDRIFRASTGSPERFFEECLKKFAKNPEKRKQCSSTIQRDWGGDTERLRKSQLKAFLEQTKFEQGKIKFFDPNDPLSDGVDFNIMDLDHVIPLSKGGKHGVGLNESINDTKYPSGNFVWTNKNYNRAYKSNRDIIDTVEEMSKIREQFLTPGKKGGVQYDESELPRLFRAIILAKRTQNLSEGIKSGNFPSSDDLKGLTPSNINLLANAMETNGHWSNKVTKAFKKLDNKFKKDPDVSGNQIKARLLSRYFDEENRKKISHVKHLTNITEKVKAEIIKEKADRKEQQRLEKERKERERKNREANKNK